MFVCLYDKLTLELGFELLQTDSRAFSCSFYSIGIAVFSNDLTETKLQ